MSRNLVYVNGQSESITFETGPYLIVKIEGLGIPNVDRQEQKAPYQDGTTYIDSLLQNRDIVVELAITKPNDFANIALYRRELSQRLCPKYGLGTLTYTDEDGNAYNIRAVVSSMVFPNKDYRDPYMRAMVTFTACDPYWKDVTTDSISLPTSVTSGESVINGSQTYGSSAVELANGSILVVYNRASDNYIVSRTYTTSWSAESVINAAGSRTPSVIRLSNGNLFLAYTLLTGSVLVSRTYTTSWSAESVINATATNAPFSCGKDELGNIFALYSRAVDYYLMMRIYSAGSWGAESIVNPAGSNAGAILSRSDGGLFAIYTRFSDAAVVSRMYKTSWSSESIIKAGPASSSTAIELSDSSLFVLYVNASTYLSSVTRSVTPVPAVITGDVPAPFLVTFNGPSVNPRIIDQDTLEYIRLNTTLAAGDSFEVNTSFGNKTVVLVQSGITKNGIAFLDIGSTFFQLERGSNVVYFEDDAVASTATATMEWTERYVGL